MKNCWRHSSICEPWYIKGKLSVLSRCYCTSWYCHELGGGGASMTFKYVGFGLDTRFIVHLRLTTLVVTIYCGALANSPVTVYIALLLFHSYSLQSTIHIHWVLVVSCPSSPWVRLPMVDVPLPWFSNYPRHTAIATLGSLCTYWNSLLGSVDYLLHWLSKWNSKSCYNRQSVSQLVRLDVKPTVRLATRY
jgi:hypothetical protein